MKLLRNPVVTGVLALVAVTLVFYRLVQPSWRSPVASGRTPAPARPMPPAPAPLPAAPAPAAELVAVQSAPEVKPLLPAQQVDRAYAERHSAEWADAPIRDPFLIMPVVPPRPVHQYPSPVMKWKLKAIWRQANSRVAAINNHVYQEGDSIEGYRIEKIDGDQVWFQGPDRMERLGFDQPEPGPARKSPRS